MRKKLQFIIPLSLIVMLMVSACEIERSGDSGDIAIDTPDIGESTAAPSTVEAPPPTEPTEEVPAVSEPIDSNVVEAPDTPPGTAFVPGTALVKLESAASIQARTAELGSDDVVVSGVNELDEKLQQIGATELEPLIEEVADSTGQDMESLSAQSAEVGQLYVVNFPPEQNPQEVVETLEEAGSVEYAEPNFVAGIAGSPPHVPQKLQPNDQYYGFQWNLPKIQMPAAWDVSTGDDVTVAIVDTGVAFNASDLAETSRLPGYDFVNDDADPTDDQGHGTHVAGTVAQTTNNQIGVAGTAFDATLLPVKVLNANGNGSYADIIKGIIYAVDQGADVINLSLAGRNGTQALRDTVKYAHDRGVTVVAAAGNDGGSVSYPAAYDDYVIAVGATGFNDTLTDYSNRGPEIDFVAPGGDVGVDLNNDSYGDGILQQTFSSTGSGFSYRFYEGTSMASPHVAGAAALLLSRKSDASPGEIESILAQTARNLGPANEYGAGLIQAADALAQVMPDEPPTVTPEATAEPTEEPTVQPTEEASPTPTSTNTPLPVSTEEPTAEPTEEPTREPTGEATEEASPTPTATPSPTVTATPTDTPSPTPTATTQPTVTPLPAGELLVNSGFESDEGWVLGDTPVRGSYAGDVTLSGDRALKLGLTEGQDAFSYTSAWQRVSIPQDAKQVTLTANIYPVSQDDPRSGDVQNILILNEFFRPIRTLSRQLSNSQAWETVSYDLSDLAGRTIYIYFGVFNGGRTGEPTALYVDDVSLTWAK